MSGGLDGAAGGGGLGDGGLWRGQRRLLRGVLVAAERARRPAADELGVADPDAEFSRWLEEQEQIERERGARSANGRAAVGSGRAEV